MIKAIRKHRYNILDGKPVIDVSVKQPAQLFDFRDPTPFRERDLDKGFFRHIVSVAQELPRKQDFKIRIHIGSSRDEQHDEASIREAIHRYFVYKENYQAFLLREFMKRTQRSFLLGLMVLFACLGLTEYLSRFEETWSLSVLKEGLIVIGWVSIWKPIELMMFGWGPVYQELKFYRRFLRAEVEVVFAL